MRAMGITLWATIGCAAAWLALAQVAEEPAVEAPAPPPAPAPEHDLSEAPLRIISVDTDKDRSVREIVDVVYPSEAVRTECQKTPDDSIGVALNGYTVPVDCALWHIWNARQETLRTAEQAAPAAAE